MPSDAIVIIVRVFIRLSSRKYKEFFTQSFPKSERRCYGARGTSTMIIMEILLHLVHVVAIVAIIVKNNMLVNNICLDLKKQGIFY